LLFLLRRNFTLTKVLQEASVLCSGLLGHHWLLIHQPYHLLPFRTGYSLSRTPLHRVRQLFLILQHPFVWTLSKLTALQGGPDRFPRQGAGLAQICNLSFWPRENAYCVDRKRKKYQIIVHSSVTHGFLHQTIIRPPSHWSLANVIIKDNNNTQIPGYTPDTSSVHLFKGPMLPHFTGEGTEARTEKATYPKSFHCQALDSLTQSSVLVLAGLPPTLQVQNLVVPITRNQPVQPALPQIV
jgi:hypothetical protein